MQRTDPAYAAVTNWTLVHELIRAALKAREALAGGHLPGNTQTGDIAMVYLDKALMGVDEAHELAEKFRATVTEFGEEKARGDDTNDDGPTPLISLNEDYDEENYSAPQGVGGIWVSCCEYLDLTADKDADDEAAESTAGAPASFDYSPWRHGGWYVNNVRYPSGAVGCVSRNYPDRKWRIACDPRPFEERPTFRTRDDAARAEWEGIQSGELLKQIPEPPTQPGATPA